MIVYEDRHRVGHDAVEETFAQLVSTTPPATSIDRASYLYGLQTFCRQQLKRELTAAIESLEAGVVSNKVSRNEGIRSRPAHA